MKATKPMEASTPNKQEPVRRPYEKPRIESEPLFEAAAAQENLSKLTFPPCES